MANEVKVEFGAREREVLSRALEAYMSHLERQANRKGAPEQVKNYYKGAIAEADTLYQRV